MVQPHGGKPGQWFEGYVHVVRKEEVGLRFNHSFRGWTEGQRYKIRFKLNRIPLRRQHQALETVFTPRRLFFPNQSDVPVRTCYSQLRPFNMLVASNPAQLQAVASIVDQRPGAVPFVIFGPCVFIYSLSSIPTNILLQTRHRKDCHGS